MNRAGAWSALSWIALAASASQPQGPPPATVRVDAASMVTLEQWREVTGELRSPTRALIAAEEPGRVASIPVEEGDAVEAGAVIATLDDRRAKLEVRIAESAVALRAALVIEREASLDKAERDLARWEDAGEQGSATQNELEEARNEAIATRARVEQARADAESARAQLDLARQRLDDMTIEAPFSGRVVGKRTEPGQWVSQGDPVIDLVRLDELEAWINVPERLVDRLRAPDLKVQVRVEASGEVIEALVTRIIPDVDRLSRLAPVRIRMPNPESRLLPGMSVTGLIPSGRDEPVLTVHKDALLRDDAGAYVYTMAGGVAAVARVTPLFAAGKRMAVRSSALTPGALVVTEGNERLFPGQPLIPQGAGGPDAAREGP